MNLTTRLTLWLHRQWQRRGLFSMTLRPLSALAGWLVRRKEQKIRHDPTASYRCPVAVVVVGNIIVGGAGKTPVVQALATQLRALGWTPGIISRGYGVAVGPEPRIGQGELQAAQFGDEPALIAAQTQAPIAVHPKRVLAAQALLRAFPHVDLIISDDGLQHLALQRDLEVVVQDARGVGNGLMLPAGPLREPPTRLRRADWLITQLNADQPQPDTPHPQDPARCLSMTLAPHRLEHLASGRCIDWAEWRDRQGETAVQALAAIGQPERFFSMLRLNGLTLSQTHARPDHAALSRQDFADLGTGPILITRKDAVKCRNMNDPRLWAVDVLPVFTRPDWIQELDGQLRLRRAASSPFTRS
ncbi:tetraacyldisaccharide 4'-kinase [Alcaligenes sp. SDU_A2]|uniref:tetraacyldisaccharide 4'-kinase n=1 Tax=Alcaligenes sp. SDU_A2 TaxID=3136634 RepID=UPI00311EE781